MLCSTRGIVLRFIKYGETSIIATIYTEEFGLASYIINGVRSKRSKGKIALLQPLSLLDLVVYHKVGRDINRLSELKSLNPLSEIRSNIYKSSIGMFIAEVLNKCIKEESPNESLFRYLMDSIQLLNELSSDYENFHLVFLLKLSKFLGFAPQNSSEFLADIQPLSSEYSSLQKKILETLMDNGFATKIAMSSKTRGLILTDILNYYRIHIDLPPLKSLKILHTILND
jgi:DNA repair protein RecO (recombination protein O)